MNCKNPKDWRTKNPIDDVMKFELIRNESLNSKRGNIKDETLKAQIRQVRGVHQICPQVRFYGFHKEGKKFADKHYGCMWDYDRCSRLPDGYFFHYPYGIFIIEIENYSRVGNRRILDYIKWWGFFDGIQETSLHIMEFNRYGEFQKDIIKETSDKRDSTEILNSLTNVGVINNDSDC